MTQSWVVRDATVDDAARCAEIYAPYVRDTAVSFELEGRPFFALDGGPGHPFTKAVSFQTFPGTQEEFDARWDALVDGGRPLECSWLIDRFGLQWQVVPEPYLTAMRSGDQDVIHAAFSALMVPGKPDFAAVVAAVENVRS